MKKTIYLLLVTVLLSNCTTTPIIDSAGRSGTFNESKAVEITNDLQHCERIAKQHNIPVVFGEMKKVKRGFYKVFVDIITEYPKKHKDFEITDIFLKIYSP